MLTRIIKALLFKQLITVVTDQSNLFFVAGLWSENEMFMLSVKYYT